MLCTTRSCQILTVAAVIAAALRRCLSLPTERQVRLCGCWGSLIAAIREARVHTTSCCAVCVVCCIGIVSTLPPGKEFGFIKCAEREVDLFFKFSDVVDRDHKVQEVSKSNA
mgnify:CR=1 FL=1